MSAAPGSRPRRSVAALMALAATLALAGCSADRDTATGSTPTGPTSTGGAAPSPASPTPTAEPTPSETPAPSSSPTETTETGLIDAQNLCELLDLRELVRITGMQLRACTFDGAICTWEAKDEVGYVAMSLGKAERTTAYVDEVQELDIATTVNVAGADDAAAVTIDSGSGGDRSTRIALVAKVGRERLTVILTGRNADLDTAVLLAELVTAG